MRQTYRALGFIFSLLTACDSSAPTPNLFNPDAQANPVPTQELCLIGHEKIVWTEDCSMHCALAPASPVFDQCYRQDGVDLGRLYTFGATSQPADVGYQKDFTKCAGPSYRFFRMTKLNPQPKSTSKLYVDSACKTPPWYEGYVNLPLPDYYFGVEVLPLKQ